MKFITNKEKGNTSLGIAIAYYSSNGYTVIEELFVFLENREIYIMPIGKIKNKSTLTICDKYKEYKMDFLT